MFHSYEQSYHVHRTANTRKVGLAVRSVAPAQLALKKYFLGLPSFSPFPSIHRQDALHTLSYAAFFVGSGRQSQRFRRLYAQG